MGKPAMASSPRITPHLWFDKEAKEAAAFYCSVFDGLRRADAQRRVRHYFV
jgi:predicted 3-demethylubiquinone-9 3-methyltransferase (glyoxalase superfamily)